MIREVYARNLALVWKIKHNGGRLNDKKKRYNTTKDSFIDSFIHLKQLKKKQTKIYETTALIRQRRTVISVAQETTTMNSRTGPAYCLERARRPGAKEGVPDGDRWTPSVRRQS